MRSEDAGGVGPWWPSAHFFRCSSGALRCGGWGGRMDAGTPLNGSGQPGLGGGLTLSPHSPPPDDGPIFSIDQVLYGYYPTYS